VSGPALTVDVAAIAGDPPRTILLVRRANEPFAGSWALPGGFVEADERVAAAAARELAEETGVRAAALELLGVFDTPGRDPRGPTVSIVYVMLADAEPAARGGDDASEARWHTLDALPVLGFDHAAVIAEAVSFAAAARRRSASERGGPPAR
jgi:8-oxo-dGTP diphosphatase